MASRIAEAINQSFGLVFKSIYRGFEFIFSAIKKVIVAISNLIKRLHSVITSTIQLLLNLSSILFVLFIPYAFFFDPLDWSGYAYEVFSEDTVMLIRYVLGAFFAMVAALLLSSLWKSWKDVGTTASATGEQVEAKGDFVRSISGLIAWLIIAAVFVYFTVFRYQLLGVSFDEESLPAMLGQ